MSRPGDFKIIRDRRENRSERNHRGHRQMEHNLIRSHCLIAQVRHAVVVRRDDRLSKRDESVSRIDIVQRAVHIKRPRLKRAAEED
ncbi:hypothetical protein B7486_01565 [cyanobacterium TDX16]|nr:hypothetical protein B7486_01565 [cyanobacterium TDX16]